MLSEHEENLSLKAENKKLRDIIEYLESKNQKYEQFIKTLGGEIERTESILHDSNIMCFGRTDFATKVTDERIRIPEMCIGYKGQYAELQEEIKQILSK